MKKNVLTTIFMLLGLVFGLAQAGGAKRDFFNKVNAQELEQVDFLFDVQGVLDGAREMCDDLEYQLGFFSKFWFQRFKKKTLLDHPEIGNMLKNIDDVKKGLNDLIDSVGSQVLTESDPKESNEPRQEKLNELKEKLVSIKKIVDFYKQMKMDEANSSSWKYPKLAWQYFKAGPLMWALYPFYIVFKALGKQMLRILGAAADWVAKLTTTFLLFVALAGVINGIYFSDSFIYGFLAPFGYLFSFVKSFFVEKSCEELMLEINQSRMRWINFHFHRNFATIVNFGLEWTVGWFKDWSLPVPLEHCKVEALS